MFGSDAYASLYVVAALLFLIVLVIHFGLRRWRFNFAVRNGWILYALSLPCAGLSLFLVFAGAPWWMWTGGFLYLAWALFGFIVEYVRHVQWRGPVLWPVFVPATILSLGSHQDRSRLTDGG
jgi:hypothetical protein